MVWFRRPKFLSKLGQERTKPVVNYRYMPIHDFDETEQKIVFDYVKAIDKPLHEGKVAVDKTDKRKKCEVKRSFCRCFCHLNYRLSENP
jgi:hypothetical protein